MEKDNESVVTYPDQKPLKRIASIDFQRGLAVWLMVFLHVFNHIYDYSWVDMDTLFDGSVPILLAIYLVLMAFLGGWAGYFVLLSGIATTLTFIKGVNAGKSSGNLLKKQLLMGLGILIAGYLTEAFGYYGYFGASIKAESWLSFSPFLWRRLYIMEALQIIGYAYILNAFALFFITLGKGKEKYWRNIIIYAILFVLILSVTPLVWNIVDNLPWEIGDLTGYHSQWPSEVLQYENASFSTYLYVIIAGDLYPIFPFITTTFAGAIIGILLAMPHPPKKTPLYIAIANTLLLVVIIGIILFGNFDITFERPTIGYYLLLLWAQIGSVNILLWWVEFRGKGQKFGDSIFVKYFRRWGIIPMSIFALQILSLAPRIIFNFTVPETNLINERIAYGNEGIVFIFAVVTVLFYDLLIWLWGKINFAGSFEWLVLSIGKLKQKEKYRRLNFHTILNNVKWINYVPKDPKLD
ncbi:MAG: hypothetical protein ACTSRK_13570 [Promethearchaeota archaeon]